MLYTLLVTTVKRTENLDGHIVTQYSHCTKAFFFTFKPPYGCTVHRTQPTRRAQPSLTHLTYAQHHLYQTSPKLGNKCEEGDTNSLTLRSKCGLHSADLHEPPSHSKFCGHLMCQSSKFGNNRRQLDGKVSISSLRAAQLSQHTIRPYVQHSCHNTQFVPTCSTAITTRNSSLRAAQLSQHVIRPYVQHSCHNTQFVPTCSTVVTTRNSSLRAAQLSQHVIRPYV